LVFKLFPTSVVEVTIRVCFS